jgi:hypothetical protein
MSAEHFTRADALIWLAQNQEAAPLPHAAAHWVSYSGGAAIYLAIVLLVVASGFAYAGRRLPAPLEVARPQGAAAAFVIAISLLAIYSDAITAFVYGLQVKEAYPDFVAARVRAGTFIDAPVTFFVILYLTRRWGLEGRAGERHHRHCRRADDLRASLRSDRHGAD